MKPVNDRRWAVELDGFSKIYRPGWSGRCIHAVRSITLRLPPGQILGLLGPNGSGKSTTLRVLAGLVRPSGGVCRVFGSRAGSTAARAAVGYLPDSAHFSPHLSAREFLRYCAGLSSVPRRLAADRVEAVLGWGGLSAAGGQRLAGYSRGMLQRLGLAQAILHDPELILLDEPANGLDPVGRRELDRLIRDLAQRGKTVVFSSHLPDQVEQLCDRLAILRCGELLADGTPTELLGPPASPRPLASRLEEFYLAKVLAHG